MSYWKLFTNFLRLVQGTPERDIRSLCVAFSSGKQARSYSSASNQTILQIIEETALGSDAGMASYGSRFTESDILDSLITTSAFAYTV